MANRKYLCEAFVKIFIKVLNSNIKNGIIDKQYFEIPIFEVTLRQQVAVSKAKNTFYKRKEDYR